jgi:hypothetical protein
VKFQNTKGKEKSYKLSDRERESKREREKTERERERGHYGEPRTRLHNISEARRQWSNSFKL